MLGFLATSISRVSCFFVSSGLSCFSAFFFSGLGFGVKKSGYSSSTLVFSASFVLHFFFSIDFALYIAFGLLYSVSFTSSVPVMLGFLASSFNNVSCFFASNGLSFFSVLDLGVKKSG